MRQPRTLQPIWMVLLVTIIATLGLGCRTVPLQGERKEEKGAEVDIPEIEYEE